MLTETQREALELLVRSGITENFYLSGGTALMMRYDHRHSYDFDFFTMPGLEVDFGSLISPLPVDDIILLEERPDTLIFELVSVRCSFFRYNYPLLKDCSMNEGYGVAMASDEDIAAMKAVAVIQRGKKKDFYDLWYLMSIHNWDLEEIMGFCQEVWQQVQPRCVLKGLGLL